MARKPQPPSRPEPRAVAEEAFGDRILELWARTRQSPQIVTGTLVVLAILVLGTVYYVNQRGAHLELAASELETAQMAALIQESQQAQDELRAYISRFSDTPFALEAYLVLAELQLRSAQVDRAITTLQEVAPSSDTPLQVQATFLLAVGYETAERWADAAGIYEDLLADAPYGFQKREAGAGLARAHLAQGNLAGAVGAYEALLATLAPDHPDRASFEMRLAEVQAQL